MTLKQYLIFMGVGSALCWAVWLFIIFSVDPFTATTLIIALFYLSLFLALLGTSSVTGLLLKVRLIKNDEIVFRHVKRTFRQSVLVAVLAVAVLLLAHAHLLRWWNATLLIALFFGLEGLIFTNRRYRNEDYVR